MDGKAWEWNLKPVLSWLHFGHQIGASGARLETLMLARGQMGEALH
jgi:hypothetical protein